MAYLTANGQDVVAADVFLPRTGVWRADLTLQTADAASFAPGTRVTLAGALGLTGTVRRSGLSVGHVFLRMVGGAGGLAAELAPKSYRSISLKIPIGDILSDAGETLDATSDAGILASALNFWSRSRGPAGSALNALTFSADATWRVLPNGNIWVGTESWPTSSMKYDLLLDEPSLGRFQFFAVTPTILPGQTLDGRRISYVEHHFDARSLRSRAWVEG